MNIIINVKYNSVLKMRLDFLKVRLTILKPKMKYKKINQMMKFTFYNNKKNNQFNRMNK